MDNNEKAKMKMDLAIWDHGRKKANCTITIKKLKEFNYLNSPSITEAIKTLEQELERLKKTSPFD